MDKPDDLQPPRPQGPPAPASDPARKPAPTEFKGAPRPLDTQDFFLAPPAVSLPQGGGAVRGIDEQFRVNPVTGTASLSVPLAASPGRAGTGPKLALSYDSGAGNSPFGLGWQLDAPSITRKTQRGLPRYTDADTFVFGDDLVPALALVADAWVPVVDDRDLGGVPHRVNRFRPRTEGAFDRIERWTNRTTGEAWWTVTSRDNVVQVFGRSAAARTADPSDPTKVFAWHLEEVRDEVGNVTWFSYKPEDRAGVDPSTPCEAARAIDGCAYTYLKRVRYGNRTPFLADPGAALDDEWAFELVFDYGEHTGDTPSEDVAWPVRLDPYSSFRPGFDQRCYRLCQRVLVFHRFTALGASPALVRSTVLTHAPSPAFTTLSSVTHIGHDGATTASLPAMQFTYRQPELDDTVRFVSGTDDLPHGLDLSRFQWVDLDGEGLTGLLGEHGGAWWYKPSLGAGALAPLRSGPE